MKSYFFVTAYEDENKEMNIKRSRAFEAKNIDEAWKIALKMRDKFPAKVIQNAGLTKLFCVDAILNQKCSERYVNNLQGE
jgi:hypothetical protein